MRCLLSAACQHVLLRHLLQMPCLHADIHASNLALIVL
jgi:predicted unusual protein kinase regulating ubiquinone biosynthesis (AarF/ABC1/UbiB family)